MKSLNAPRNSSRRILSASVISLLAVSVGTHAQTVWVGDVDQDWNNALNWAGDVFPAGPPPAGHAAVNVAIGNYPIISSNSLFTPVDIFVGNGAGTTGRLDHTAGSASTGAENWMFVGVSGGTGTYNLANTSSTGGTLTGFGQGTGSMTVGNNGPGGRLYIGGRDNGGGGNGTVNVNTSGTLTIRNDLTLGASGGTGVLNVDAGTITTGGWNFFGKNEGGTGGSGTLRMSGGTLTNTGRTYVGQTGTTGKIELTGSGRYLNVNNEIFVVGEGAGSLGEIVVNGPTAELRSEGELWIGQGAGGNGNMTVSAGTVSVGNWFAVGREGATGVLTINGTALVQKTDNDGSLELTNGGSTTASGTVNLDGGTLRVNNITGSGGAGSVANLFLNGGTLKPTTANTDFIGGNVVPLIKSGGAIIDTDGFDITINKALNPDGASTGGLTKIGLGKLTLTATNTYTGATTVTGGTLALESGGSIETTSGILVNGATAKLVQNSFLPLTKLVTVTNGTLDGTGTFDRVTVTDAGTLINGVANGVLTVGTLTFNGAGTLVLQTSAGAPVSIATTSLVTGATNPAGIVDINVSNTNGLWTVGNYSLISYTTLGPQGFSNFRKGTVDGLGARQTAALTNSAGVIGLTITGDLPVWTGAQNGNWTTDVIGGLSNWKLQNANTPTDFITGDTVLFDDSATGTTNVNISTANVSPTSTTFDNSTKDYTISSAGGFGIASGSLTKNGSRAVTLATANTYSGGTTLNNGTLNLNNSSALGTGSFTVNAGTIDNTSGAAITLATNNAIRLTSDITFTGTNALNVGTGAVTLASVAPTQTISITNNSTLPGTSLTFGGPVTGTGGATYTVNISGSGNTAFTGNITTGASSGLFINDNLPGTLTLSGPASSITALAINGGATSIVELGAGNLTVGNGGGNIVQSTTGGTINATGGGSIVLGSGNGDFGTAGGTTLTVNARISGANALDFYNSNGGEGLGTIVLAAANDYTGTTNVENTRVVVPAGGSINGANTAGVGLVNVGTVGGTNGVLQVTGGTINANNGGTNVLVGTASGANGALNVSAGSVNAASEFWVGGGAGSFGSLKMTGGTVAANAWFVIGRNSNGTADISGGTLNVTNRNFITASTGVRAVTNLTGTGVVNVTGTGGGNGSVYVGEAFRPTPSTIPSVGEVNISGSAALNISGGDGIFLGINDGGSGTVNFNGGTVTTPIVKKGVGTGFVNFDGGTLKATASTDTFMQNLDSAYVNDGGAIIDDGGFSITVGQPLLAPTGNGVASMTLFGGTGYIGAPLVEITGDGTGATAVANVDATGTLTGITVTNPGIGYTTATATISGGGGNAAVDTVLLQPNVSGGFTKRGTGSVTLAGANTYTGATVIEAGTLALTGSISGSNSITPKAGASFDVTAVPGGFTLANGQTLRGNGTVIGAVAMGAGSRLAPGEGLGTLAVNGSLNLSLAATNNGALEFELGVIANSDKVTLSNGALSIGTGVLGFLDFMFPTLAGAGAGTYTLFDTNTAIVGTLDGNNLSGSLANGLTGTIGFADGRNDLVLTVVPEPGSAALLIGGIGALAGMRFRRRAGL
jgi:autotransporter-associated beta strand protein